MVKPGLSICPRCASPQNLVPRHFDKIQRHKTHRPFIYIRSIVCVQNICVSVLVYIFWNPCQRLYFKKPPAGFGYYISSFGYFALNFNWCNCREEICWFTIEYPTKCVDVISLPILSAAFHVDIIYSTYTNHVSNVFLGITRFFSVLFNSKSYFFVYVHNHSKYVITLVFFSQKRTI